MNRGGLCTLVSIFFEVRAIPLIVQLFSSSIWPAGCRRIRILLGRPNRGEKPLRDLRVLAPDGSRFYLAISRLSPPSQEET